MRTERMRVIKSGDYPESVGKEGDGWWDEDYGAFHLTFEDGSRGTYEAGELTSVLPGDPAKEEFAQGGMIPPGTVYLVGEQTSEQTLTLEQAAALGLPDHVARQGITVVIVNNERARKP